MEPTKSYCSYLRCNAAHIPVPGSLSLCHCLYLSLAQRNTHAKPSYCYLAFVGTRGSIFHKASHSHTPKELTVILITMKLRFQTVPDLLKLQPPPSTTLFLPHRNCLFAPTHHPTSPTQVTLTKRHRAKNTYTNLQSFTSHLNMPVTLESLPEELLLMVSSFVIEPTGLEIGLHYDRTYANHQGYLIENPASEGLSSLQLTSRTLSGPASDVFRNCKALTVNLFHSRKYERTSPDAPISLPGRIISDEVFKEFNDLEMTVPFHFVRGHNSSSGHAIPSLNWGPITDVLMACNMKFSRPKSGGKWICHAVSVEKVNACEGWNFTPEVLEKAVQHIKDLAPSLVCDGLNVKATNGRFFKMIPVGKATANNATVALTSYRLVMAIQHYLRSMRAGSHRETNLIVRPLFFDSRRGRRWFLAPAWSDGLGSDLEVEHFVRATYTDYEEATEMETRHWSDQQKTESLLKN